MSHSSPSPDRNTGGTGGETRVFLENLPKDVRKDELVRGFSCYGDIAKIYLIYDPPGSGFVEFTDSRDALVAADQVDGTDLLGVGLKIKTRLTRGGFSRGRGFDRGGRGFSSYDDTREYSSNRGRGGFRGGRGSYEGSRDSYSQGGSFRGSRGSYGESRGGFRGSRGSYGDFRGGFRGSRGGGFESRGRFQSSRGGFRGSRGGYDRPKRDYDEMRSDYDDSGSKFRGSSSSYDKSYDQYEEGSSGSYGSSYNNRGSGYDNFKSKGSRPSSYRDDDDDDFRGNNYARKYKHNFEESESGSNGFSGGKFEKYTKYQKFGRAIGIDEEPDTKYSKYPNLDAPRKDSYHRSRSPMMESGRNPSAGRYQSQSSGFEQGRSHSPQSREARDSDYPSRSFDKNFVPTDKDEFRRPRSKFPRELPEMGRDATKHREKGKEFASSSSYGNRPPNRERY